MYLRTQITVSFQIYDQCPTMLIHDWKNHQKGMSYHKTYDTAIANTLFALFSKCSRVTLKFEIFHPEKWE